MKTKLLIGAALCFSLAGLTPAQDTVKERLEKSPRHHEWVEVKHGKRVVTCFLVFPEVKNKATAVLVIHENKGLTDWVRGVADQLAEKGFIAIAPDLLSPEGKKTADFPGPDAATKALYKLDPERVTADLNAVADHVIKLPAANGKLAVAGFCWGGGQTFRFATNRSDLKAACVFYGPAPDSADAIARIKAPVYGFYGGNDARINAGIEPAAKLMKEKGKTFEPAIYDEAGHGFMRAGEDAKGSAPNRKARTEGWQRLVKILEKL